jgi:hypothetical protein
MAIAEFNRLSAIAQAIKVNGAMPEPLLLPLPHATVDYVPFKGYRINGVLREQTAAQLVEYYREMGKEHKRFIERWQRENMPDDSPEDSSDIPF